METRQFIDQLAAGDSVAAKESLENLLSAKAFESLDSYKKELASSIFTGKKEVETQEETTQEQ